MLYLINRINFGHRKTLRAYWDENNILAAMQFYDDFDTRHLSPMYKGEIARYLYKRYQGH